VLTQLSHFRPKTKVKSPAKWAKKRCNHRTVSHCFHGKFHLHFRLAFAFIEPAFFALLSFASRFCYFHFSFSACVKRQLNGNRRFSGVEKRGFRLKNGGWNNCLMPKSSQHSCMGVCAPLCAHPCLHVSLSVCQSISLNIHRKKISFRIIIKTIFRFICMYLFECVPDFPFIFKRF